MTSEATCSTCGSPLSRFGCKDLDIGAFCRRGTRKGLADHIVDRLLDIEKLRTVLVCSHCGGDGMSRSTPHECRHCRGTGKQP